MLWTLLFEFYKSLCAQVQYPQSNSARISKVRDLPPVAGSIIWARQIDHQLTTYLRRVEDVLGKIKIFLQKV